MKPTNLEGVGSHAEAIIRGWVDSGITFEAGGTVADSVRDLTIIGGTLIDNGDGTWTLIIGGGSGDGTDSISSAPVNMLNAAGRDLLPGDVVVVDEANDKAVTVTTSAGDTRIAGVVQEPIADGAIGKVLFNGFTAIINSPGAVRGEYAQTSTTETVADSTSAREAGSFAVYLTGTDVPDFATASVTTTAPVPVSSLAISVPAVIPTGRYLFLALWLTDDGSAPSVPGWTQIGATSGFYYFARSSTGGDTASATWTGASTAVATVLLLHPSVVLAAPLEDFDYDATTSAASLSGLSDVAHYAIAGVDADVATPGSGFTRLGGGSADFSASGTPVLVQQSSYATSTGAITASLPAAATVGNLVVGLASAHDRTSMYLTDPRDGGTCPIDSHASFYIDANTTPGANTALSLQGYNSADGYAGPFGSKANCSTPAYHAIAAYEFSGVATSGSETLSSSGSHNETAVDVGDFTVGPNDLVLMAATWQHSQSDPGIATNPNGFTTLYDGFGQLGAVGWTWLGYKVGDGDCSFSAPAGTNYWTAVAVHLTGGTNQAAGTLAGKYIGHDAAVTSPFSGGGQQDDALFAINLLADAKPSALLYGPDLGGSGSFSGNVEDIPTAETDTTLILHPDGTGGIEWGADATGGTGGKTWDYIVAASDSDASLQASADAVCDGTADQTEINAAIAAAVTAARPYSILLCPGTYSVSGAVDFTPWTALAGNWCVFEASGTKIVAAANLTTMVKLDPGAGGQIVTCADIRLGVIDGDDSGGHTVTQLVNLARFSDNMLRIEDVRNGSGIGFKASQSGVSDYPAGNNKIDIEILRNFDGTAFMVTGGTNAEGFQGNTIHIGEIIACDNGIILGASANQNASYNTFIVGVIEHNTNAGIYDYCGGNTFIVGNLNTHTTHLGGPAGMTLRSTYRVHIDLATSGTIDAAVLDQHYVQVNGVSYGRTLLTEKATPGTPASGFGDIYFKSDGYLYSLNDSGTERQLGAGSALTVQDEGTPLATDATTLNFVGAGVVASGSGATKTITIAGSSVAVLDDLSDVTITSPASADRLRYSGSAWVNSALRWEPHVAYDGTVVLDGNGDPVMVEVS